LRAEGADAREVRVHDEAPLVPPVQSFAGKSGSGLCGSGVLTDAGEVSEDDEASGFENRVYEREIRPIRDVYTLKS